MREEEIEVEDTSLAVALVEEFGGTPWYVTSTLIHAIILILLFLLISPQVENIRRSITIEMEFLPEEPPVEEKDPEIKEDPKEVPIESDVKVEVPEVIVTTTDVQVSEKIETESELNNDDAEGDPDNLASFDSQAKGTPALIGVGASGGGGGGGIKGNRIGSNKRTALRIGDGGPNTERAVNAGLRWLAEHQEADGSWDCDKYEGGNHDPSVTAMALLAFLGSGNSMEFGEYKNNVKRGVQYLISQHDGNGLVGKHRYEAAITLMALAEAYGMGSGSEGDRELENIVQKQVDYAVRTQNDSGSWDYKPNSMRNDTSVMGWWVMGLKSAKVAGFDVPKATVEKALKHLENEAYVGGDGYDDGKVLYTPGKGGTKPAMVAVYLSSAQFLGRSRTDQKVVACAGASLNDLPTGKDHYLYKTYYQALGLFQMGPKSEYWRTFNKAMKSSVLSGQIKTGTVKDKKGSWDPDSSHAAKEGGRVYQTALSVLCMEIYYRYQELEKR